MATLLDTLGLLNYFSVIFPFLMVFVIIYAILLATKVLGDDKGVASIVALCIAGLMLLSPNLLKLINYTTPWFVIIIIFALFVLVIFRFMGTPESAITDVMKKWDTLHWFILAAVLIIFVAGVSEVYGPSIAGYGDPSGSSAPAPGQVQADGTASGGFNTFQENVVRNILFHPKIVGLVFILIVASFTIRILAGRPK